MRFAFHRCESFAIVLLLLPIALTSSSCARSTPNNAPRAAKPAPAAPATEPIARNLPATIASTHPNNPMDVLLKDSDLPLQKLFLLERGDRIVYTLPRGLRLVWDTKRDSGSAEQTTRSGLKAHISEPGFDLLKDYGVTTSTTEKVSIYGFDIDGYHRGLGNMHPESLVAVSRRWARA